MSQRFPPGIPVGRVARVDRDPGGLVQEIEVHPTAPLTRLREVFVHVDSTRQMRWRAGEEAP
jgi:cell shape-determining protein MreC